MIQKSVLLAIFLTCISCTQKNKETLTEKTPIKTEVKKAVVVDTVVTNQNWYDPLMANYIKNSDKELIRQHLKNKDTLEWLLDNTEKTDSTHYYIFNIGLEVSDKGNTNKRFSSCGWVYIDSLSKKIYEYDLPNDRLVLWEKKH